ncbi:ergosterol biosynthesis ERG4/ERG24 [Gymnopilus junonius]|uniref:Delta(14)-sterol reductase ERG24 n=1 Tax=Gymnopilus junonius TaxID=109634 RepID=A0A9P5TN17_GYMJU|nr:ergosterol biosynthesis ERG4/ERG24 [Gymnopilus junonius]
MSNTLNPRTKHYEFLGPPGALVVSIGVPVMTYLLYFGCSEASGGCKLDPSSIPERVVQSVTNPDWWKSLWDTEAALIYLAWYAFSVLAWAILPGDWVPGTTLRSGGKKLYKINGAVRLIPVLFIHVSNPPLSAFSTFLLALGIASGVVLRFGPESFAFIYNKWVGLITASLLMSFVQAVYCYAFSFKEGKLLALGGNSGNFIYDWFIGRELNPSIGSFDLKSFNELRPGLILWVLINISMVCEQATRRGGLANVTDSMWLVLAFQTWYVADGLYNEPALFTTMDITSDGFGFMLAVGDLTWVPFVYSLQARYLAFHPVELGPINVIAILLVNFLGYYIFRDANGEKNDFRNGKNPKNLSYMTTKKGSKLLTSGWWGRSRHPNYFGDLIMALAWSLPTGFDTPITYFYVVYFSVLLIHRQLRDDEACAIKHGEDWKTYKKLVPYRIIPYIY